jgi:ubiquitin carboxyl-terminal hydrolase 8
MENAPKGIVNLGNTCYLNACIQILARIDPLSSIVENHVNTTNPTKIENQLWKQWRDIQFIMRSSGNNTELLYPTGFLTAIQTISKQHKYSFFQNHDQEDMSEFLLFFIQCLHLCMARPMNIIIGGHIENETDAVALDIYQYIKPIYEKEYSEMKELFTGIYVSFLDPIDNNSHSHLSKTPDIFSILNLPIPSPSNNNITIFDCFDEFCKTEIMDGENSWYNDKTQQKQPVRKYVKFWNFPKVLFLCLNRCSITGEKRMDVVSFPTVLHLDKYSCGYKQHEFTYELVGVCNHAGDIHNGHYTCFVHKDDDWYFCNDTTIKLVVDIAQLITPYVSCLVYVKKNNSL